MRTPKIQRLPKTPSAIPLVRNGMEPLEEEEDQEQEQERKIGLGAGDFVPPVDGGGSGAPVDGGGSGGTNLAATGDDDRTLGPLELRKLMGQERSAASNCAFNGRVAAPLSECPAPESQSLVSRLYEVRAVLPHPIPSPNSSKNDDSREDLATASSNGLVTPALPKYRQPNGSAAGANPAYKGRPSGSLETRASLDPTGAAPAAGAENLWYVGLQIIVPYLVAGLGMVGAGVVLDRVQYWTVYETVTELFILIPPLLGLKGNLEMTLASRISTQANLGKVDKGAEYFRMAWGNLAMLQMQAVCLAFFASILALLIGFIPDGGSININHAQILLASCLLTTSMASACLGVIMILVVYVTRKLNLNPDNFATPLAASLGDLVTVSALSLWARSIYAYTMIYRWLCLPIIVCYLAVIPVWYFVCKRNAFVKNILNSGWLPIFTSMSISSVGGLILDYSIKRFNGIAVFQPVINGVGGNLVAIQASRLSTEFHKMGPPGTFLPHPAPAPATFNICKTFLSKGFNSKMVRLLLAIALPGHVLYMFLISYIKNGRSIITLNFALFYLAVALLQVSILLYLANVLILNMWRRKVDPDNAAIPYLTAIGDFLGISFLSLAFFCMSTINKNDPNLGYS